MQEKMQNLEDFLDWNEETRNSSKENLVSNAFNPFLLGYVCQLNKIWNVKSGCGQRSAVSATVRKPWRIAIPGNEVKVALKLAVEGQLREGSY